MSPITTLVSNIYCLLLLDKCNVFILEDEIQEVSNGSLYEDDGDDEGLKDTEGEEDRGMDEQDVQNEGSEGLGDDEDDGIEDHVFDWDDPETGTTG